MREPGLTLTDQAAASTIATVDVADHSPSDVWRSLATSECFQAAIIDSIRESGAGTSPAEFREQLHDRDLPATYAALGVGIAAGDKRAVWDLLIDLQTLGAGRSSIEDVLAVPALLEGGDRMPTIAIRIGHAFFERRADQRREICQLIAALARTCDVRLVATGLIQRRLATEHREELPGVSEQCSTHQELPPLAELVEQARNEIDHDSREVAILRDLAESRSYHALLSEAHVSRSRISQCLSRLVDLGLVATFAGTGGKCVELLEGGREYLNVLDEEIGRQRRLDECVSDSGNSSIYPRVSPPTGGVGRTGPQDRRRMDEAVDPAYMPRWRHAAVTASATEGGVTLVDHPRSPVKSYANRT